jgi:hypothetical protein
MCWHKCRYGDFQESLAKNADALYVAAAKAPEKNVDSF